MSPQNPNSWLDTIDKALNYTALNSNNTSEVCNWMRHSTAIGNLWTPLDSDHSSEPDNQSCGLIAFAAVTGMSTDAALRLFPQHKDKKWINRREMRLALEQLGFAYSNVSEGRWPRVGLSLIHFTGPWTSIGYPARMLQNSHWVGVIDEYIFDVNWLGWLPRQNWSEIVLEQLVHARPDADGWSLLSSYELMRLL